MSHQLFSFSPQVPHSQTYSLAVDPCYRTATPKAGIHKEDDETIMASTTSQIGRLFKILTKSCPKLEKLWVSGLQPVSVLGAPTDLRPRLPRQKKSPSKTTMNGSSHGGVMKPLPPIPPVPGMNTAVGVSPSSSSSSSSSHSAVGSKEPVAVNNSQAPHSKIHSIQFVNCTILPQYLLTMILYSLPNLTALHLTQCWRGMPLRSEFLDSLVKICPGLKELTLHATQYHRDDVTPGDLLRFLRRLESSSTDDTTEGGAGALMMKSNYGGPSVCSSTAATTGSSTMSMSMSNSSSSSALATLPSSTSSMSSLHHPSSGGGGGGGGGNNGGGDMDQDHHDDDDDMSSLACVKPSALESISVWFTHQTLTLEIATELADRERHPRLKRVDFGSDSVYDQGETLIQWLHQQRPELAVCAWVRCGDTGDDRED
ncbi:hypothetical protein BGX31_004760 [Mortierella sp. GBA43]|nr:hypothetical protein BGX31_004760 [Mortierella sp. GBA43]